MRDHRGVVSNPADNFDRECSGEGPRAAVFVALIAPNAAMIVALVCMTFQAFGKRMREKAARCFVLPRQRAPLFCPP